MGKEGVAPRAARARAVGPSAKERNAAGQGHVGSGATISFQRTTGHDSDKYYDVLILHKPKMTTTYTDKATAWRAQGVGADSVKNQIGFPHSGLLSFVAKSTVDNEYVEM